MACQFCCHTFNTIDDKTAHILNHFEQETCEKCDQNLLRIGDNLYVLHGTITCIKIKQETEIPEIEYELNETNISCQLNDIVDESIKIETEHVEIDDCKLNAEYFDAKPVDDEMSCAAGSVGLFETVLECDIKEEDKIHPNESNNVLDKSAKQAHKLPKKTKLKEHSQIRRQIKAESTESENQTSFKCSRCDKQFARKDNMRLHFLRVHDPSSKKFKCNDCDSSYVRKGELEKHKQRNIICNMCGEKFCSQSLLVLHHDTHDKSGKDGYIERYKCKYDGCDELVTTNRWKHHMITKHGDQRFECDICKKTFSRKDDVRLHILSIHDPTSQKFKCDVCGYLCVSKSVLTRHQKVTHLKERNFMCSECGKTFCTKAQLRLHNNQHTGAKPYVCPYEGCSKRFRGQPQRIEHMRFHTGEKPFKCTEDGCDRKFAYNIDFKRHKFSAHGIYTKKYPCTICSKIFSENMLLTRHMKKHGSLHVK